MRFIRLLCCVIGLTGPGAASAADPFSDEEDEGYYSGYTGKSEPDKEEDAIALPSWPSGQDLVEVDLSLVNFPYTLFIDAKSVSVGEDRVIRYTAILRSADGVDNVGYEGITCNRSEVKRYAYGSRGQFRPVRKTEWRYVRKQGQDRYRDALIGNYFCPLPGGDRDEMRTRILARLKASHNPYR